MHVLAVRHVPFEGLGLIAPALEARGIRIVYADAFHGQSLSGWRSASGLIFMGGPMSANDDLPFVHQEMEILAEAVKAGQPVLGICLGAQLLARTLGARVYRNAVKEIGWAPVRWTEAAARDPLFTGLESPETVFHWHGETFDLPAGAEWLASSEACRHQAFRAGRNAWGLQFHLEVTPEMISTWCCEDGNEGDVRELAQPLDPFANSARLAELAATVFGRWASLLETRSA
jgi:GMP synthase-like glutamine amidotransferase